MSPETDLICCGCLHLINPETHHVEKGWELARFIAAPTDYLCIPCRAPLIDRLSQSLAEAVAA